MSLGVEAVACRRDNYAYLLSRPGEPGCVIIDASEGAPVKRALAERGLTPLAILTTHHHPDHVGGNLELREEFALPIYAHERDRERIPGLTHVVVDSQRFGVGGFDFQAFHLPGHTQGALTYAIEDVAFTGDTLFAGGCGRLKEGDAAQLFASLERLVRLLPPEVICYTGHEYTEANLRFAVSLLPADAGLGRRLDAVQKERALGRCTAFAPLGLELATNPFLRVSEPELALGLGLAPDTPPLEVFRELRLRKDAAS